MTDPSKSIDKLAKAIDHLATAHKESFGQIADGLESIATQIKRLGNNDAATSMGGLEGLGAVLKDSIQSLADSVGSIGEELQQKRYATEDPE